MSSLVLVLVLAACAGQDVAPPQVVTRAPVAHDAGPADATAAAGLPVPVVEVAPAPEVWLKGSTHVHARPSGDSNEPVLEVVKWYEARHYDFIVLTDHNQVTEIDQGTSTQGQISVHAPAHGLLVLAGIELTHNPSDCLPAGDKSRKCRIHVNLLGVTERPIGKVIWANRRTHERLAKYQAALALQQHFGGLPQLNHPQWFWGMTAELLTELAREGYPLVEIANEQFTPWNQGDRDHPSMETLWDAALAKGVTLWGVASDDAHDYEGANGRYPAGTGWVVVKARRDPQAILAALAAGHFYSSTGVVLERAEVEAGELVVEVAPAEQGRYTIDFIENGRPVQRVMGRSARRAVPVSGYVRALVTRDDGKHAWVQPARR